MTGPCASRRVFCTITAQDGEQFHGENLCRNPQPVCPRAQGDDYSKCETVCQQAGHAEDAALAAAGEKAAGSSVLVTGHWYVCKRCFERLRDAGVKEVVCRLAA